MKAKVIENNAVENNIAERAREVEEIENANLPDNVIPFRRDVITVIEPVIVSRRDFDMVMNYLDEETDVMSEHLIPRPRLTLID